MTDNTKKWIDFLEPERLKSNLIYASLFIANFEAFNDYLEEVVKGFYTFGYKNGKDIVDEKYKLEVLSKDSKIINATLKWFIDNGAIDITDYDTYQNLRGYRNKLSHELMSLLFEGIKDEFPKKFAQLLELRFKVEKWWVINVEIPTNEDFDDKEINENEIMTSSQITNQIILDMLSGDEKKANYYRDELLKAFNTNG